MPSAGLNIQDIHMVDDQGLPESQSVIPPRVSQQANAGRPKLQENEDEVISISSDDDENDGNGNGGDHSKADEIAENFVTAIDGNAEINPGAGEMIPPPPPGLTTANIAKSVKPKGQNREGWDNNKFFSDQFTDEQLFGGSVHPDDICGTLFIRLRQDGYTYKQLQARIENLRKAMFSDFTADLQARIEDLRKTMVSKGYKPFNEKTYVKRMSNACIAACGGDKALGKAMSKRAAQGRPPKQERYVLVDDVVQDSTVVEFENAQPDDGAVAGGFHGVVRQPAIPTRDAAADHHAIQGAALHPRLTSIHEGLGEVLTIPPPREGEPDDPDLIRGILWSTSPTSHFAAQYTRTLRHLDQERADNRSLNERNLQLRKDAVDSGVRETQLQNQLRAKEQALRDAISSTAQLHVRVEQKDRMIAELKQKLDEREQYGD